MRLKFLAVFLVLTGTGFSQSFTGTIDGYWLYNFARPTNDVNIYRAFDFREQRFALNYGELALEYKPNKVGFRTDVGFGDAADIVDSPEQSDEWRHIQQAFVMLGTDK